MSYHFEHGFRFNLPSLEAVHHAMMDLRKEIQPIGESLMASWLAKTAISVLDFYTYFGRLENLSESAGSPLSIAYTRMLDRQQILEKDKRRQPEVDFSFDICIIPQGSIILGLLFTEQLAYNDVLVTKPWFVDYGWQNSTDRDERVPEEEWNFRGAVWLRMLADSWNIPAMAGFSARISPVCPIPFPNIETVLARIPVFERRVHSILKLVLWEKYSKQQTESVGPHNCVRAINEFEEWRQNHRRRTMVNRMRHTISQKLIQRVSEENLTNNILPKE